MARCPTPLPVVRWLGSEIALKPSEMGRKHEAKSGANKDVGETCHDEV